MIIYIINDNHLLDYVTTTIYIPVYIIILYNNGRENRFYYDSGCTNIEYV